MALGVDVEIPVVLGTYKGLELNSIEIILDDDAVESRVRELLSKVMKPEPVNTSIRKGDIVTFSYEATVSKKPFPGSKCQKCTAKMGTGQFIEGFEEHFYSHRANDVITFTINFPKAHINKELEGRLARFEVHILFVERTPNIAELDDEYVQDVSEFSSLGELRDAVRQQMELENQSEMYRLMRISVLNRLASECTADIPESWISAQYDTEVDALVSDLQNKGISFEQYLSQEGLTEAEYAQRVKDEIKRSIHGNLALREIARIEGLSIEPEDEALEIAQIASSAGIEQSEVTELLKDEEHRAVFEDAILREKAFDFVLDHAVFAKGKM